MRLVEPLRVFAVAVVLALLGLAAAQEPAAQEPPRGGVVDPGTVVFRCEADTCRISWALLEDVDVASGMRRVFSGHPGGRYAFNVRTDRVEISAAFSVCGGETEIIVYPNRLTFLGAPCPPSGVVQLADLPRDARVWIEHVPVVLDDDARVHVREGSVLVRVEHADFQPYEATVVVVGNAVVDHTTVLVEYPGTLVLELATAATSVVVGDRLVLVDGGPGPDAGPDLRIASDGLRLPWESGEVTVTVERPRYEPQTFVVTVEPNTTVTHAVTLEPQAALVSVALYPVDAELEVAGVVVVPTEVLALPPGRHGVRATAPGFEPFEGTLDVVAGERLALEITLTAPPVAVRVAGAPEGATVRVSGGSPVEAAEAFDVTPGEHTFLLEAGGYAPILLERTIHPGRPETFDVTMQPYGLLRLVGAPSTALVSIDGEAVEVSPEGTVELLEGQYEVRVRVDGFERFDATAVLASGEVHDLNVTLIALPGRVHLPWLPNGVVVRLDGAVRALRDGVLVSVPPGEYELELGGTAYEPHRLRLAVGPGEDVYVEPIELIPRPATLILQNAPVGTRVKVGDADVFVYRGPVPIPVGVHEVWIAAEGHGRVRITIDAGPGARVQVPVSFD